MISKAHQALPNADALPADLLDDMVATFRALSDPTRAQLIFLLTQWEYGVSDSRTTLYRYIGPRGEIRQTELPVMKQDTGSG